MLLAEGTTTTTTTDGRRLLSADSARLMASNHTTHAQREIGKLFLEGQGWGFGGSVDIAAIDPWDVPGRYGWVGGTGTAHITPVHRHDRHPAHPGRLRLSLAVMTYRATALSVISHPVTVERPLRSRRERTLRVLTAA
jgi:hypothetical protein